MVNYVTTNEYHIYYVELPDGFNEDVLPCDDGFTIYLDPRQSRDGILRSYEHAMKHIKRDDFNKSDVQSIESQAHREGG